MTNFNNILNTVNKLQSNNNNKENSNDLYDMIKTNGFKDCVLKITNEITNRAVDVSVMLNETLQLGTSLVQDSRELYNHSKENYKTIHKVKSDYKKALTLKSLVDDMSNNNIDPTKLITEALTRK